MPLKCFCSGRELFAFDISTDQDWDALRASNRKEHPLTMPCCGADVVLRTSKLGTRHFAHARRGNCDTAPESAEHLLAKAMIVEAVRQTQWLPCPEQSGKTPGGNEWRADVLATKGEAKVAFEVQWSRQTSMETKQRQSLYAEAGVRGLWLFRQLDFPISKAVPAFRLVFVEEARNFDVLLPSPSCQYRVSRRELDQPGAWGQRIGLPQFIQGSLEGRLHFAPAVGQRMPLLISTVRIPCWKCKKETGIVMELTLAASRLFPGHPDIPLSMYELDECFPTGATDVMEFLPPALMRSHGVGVVRPRYSRTMGGSYLSNGCIHCDALQGQFFDHEHFYEPRTVFETEAMLKASWLPELEETNMYANIWWFNAH